MKQKIKDDQEKKARQKAVEAMEKAKERREKEQQRKEEKKKEELKAIEERQEARIASRSNKNLIEEEEFCYYRRMSPEEIPEAPVPQSRDQKVDFERFGIAMGHGVIYTPRVQRGANAQYRISNFIMSILFQYGGKDGGETTRLIKYENADTGETGTIELRDREIINFQDFKTALAGRNCVFKGSPIDLAGVLQRAYLFQIKASYIRELGWNTDGEFFAFSNAIVTKKGEVREVNRWGYLSIDKDEDRSYYYLPMWAEANEGDSRYDEDRKLLWKAGSKITVTKWLKMLWKAYGMNGLTAGLYVMAAEMYDVVFGTTGFFPYLFIFGKAGTGKTTLINFLLEAYGHGITGTSVVNSTQKGMARTMSQIRNGLIYLKEYSNGVSPEVDSLLKVAYDGQTYRIAQQSTDSRTKNFGVKSGIVIDGNEMPTNQSAVLDRCVTLEMEKTVFGEEETEAMKELKKISERDGMTSVTVEMTGIRDDFTVMFSILYKQTQDELRNKFGDGVSSRTINHTAMLLATYRTLKLCRLRGIDEDDAQLEWVDEDQLKEWLRELTERKGGEMEEAEETRVFFESAAEAIRNGWNGINDYYNIGSEGGLLYLNYPKFYKEYCVHCRVVGARVLGSVTMRKLLMAEESYAGKEDGRFYPASGSRNRQRGMVFRTNMDDGIRTVKGVQLIL